MNRFDYVKYDEQSENWQHEFKCALSSLAGRIETFPDGRAKALALTKLEEAYMWIGKMIRDRQIQRKENNELQEGRKNG